MIAAPAATLFADPLDISLGAATGAGAKTTSSSSGVDANARGTFRRNSDRRGFAVATGSGTIGSAIVTGSGSTTGSRTGTGLAKAGSTLSDAITGWTRTRSERSSEATTKPTAKTKVATVPNTMNGTFFG